MLVKRTYKTLENTKVGGGEDANMIADHVEH